MHTIHELGRACAAMLASALALGCQPALQTQPPTSPASAPAQQSSSIETKETFFARGRAEVDANARIKPNTRKAKNVILFVGDGMGVTTITAARIFDGKENKKMKFGEENDLSFEKFPYLAHSKTYQANQQTPDSAPTMTSIVTGSKANDGMLSVAPSVLRSDDFEGASQPENRLTTILEQAEDRGMWTGVVSTARLTHATPAACYAHSPNRDWEHDGRLTAEAAAAGFPDIARQLLQFQVRPTKMNGKESQGLEVAMGGGRARFLSDKDDDPETGKGLRKDENLAAAWEARGGRYVFDKAGFDTIEPATTGPVLGLFEADHMQYELERQKDVKGEPSLTEMTEKAIRILQRSPKGYFLMVEAGRIDHGHHEGRAKKALTDAVELSRAVEKATMLAGNDTLIIVTADHSHVFTMAGYPTRGNPILGLVVQNDSSGLPASAPAKAKDGKPFTTLGYMNGPGAVTGEREDLTTKDTTADDFRQQSLVPFDSETHGGEDVVIYARGPHAFLVQGTMEQNAIYFVMARALGFKEP